MNSDQGSIVIIEDDKEYLSLYTEILKGSYNVHAFDCASKALADISEIKPQTVILDLHLPDSDGFQVCHAFAEQGLSPSELDIIVVSGDSNKEQKLRAFEAGAADFLSKPFEIKELQHKIASSVERRLTNKKIAEATEESNELIYNSMEQASQYSQIMRFYQSLNQSSTVAEIAFEFFALMKSFGLNTSICFRLPTVTCFRQDAVEPQPIEVEIFEILRQQGRLYEFSNRLMVNDINVSFLIKNLPNDDSKLGQIRDYAAAIVEVLNAKLRDLYAKSGLNQMTTSLASNVSELSSGIDDYSGVINQVLTNMMAEISSSFHSLDMTERQENFLSLLISDARQQLMLADDNLQHVVEKLAALQKQSEQVQRSLTGPSKNGTAQSAPQLF